MLTIYSHLLWFIFLLFLFLCSVLLLIFVINTGPLLLSLSLFSTSSSPFYVGFSLDSMSCTFIAVVLLISSVIIVYSLNYMQPYSNSNYFLWLTFLFILSILLVVTISNLFYIMLGWDGLGLVSFFLIVYYQNQSSLTSGLFTLIINRIGDCFFLITISLFFLTSPAQGSWFVTSETEILVTLLLIVTLMTNSAIFPFSPWLPIAIAAPTPISALVHSSTLVTAGLYLIIRYSHILLSNSSLSIVLTCLSVFTSLYAGLNSVFERDLNKLIALSTLSHLGFIGLSLSCGFIGLAFFHLLSHALFKSLLFMAIGDIMVNLSHMQDIRFLSSGKLLTPASSAYMGVSSLNLIGLPIISGFFSKDLVLETLSFSQVSSLLICIIYLNVVLTFFYTLQLTFFNFQSSNTPPYYLMHSFSNLHSSLMLVLAGSSIVFGYSFLECLSYSTSFQSITFDLNIMPTILLTAIVLFLLTSGSQVQIHSQVGFHIFSSMALLSYVCIPVSSNAMLQASVSVINVCETGLFSFALNKSLSSQLAFTAVAVTSHVVSSPLNLALLSSSIVMVSLVF